ncbi:MAG: hypothetical protein KGZ88_22360 [Methylomicrobium sp.]|jgi:hypothetical protein|nr:hypothetical protein [Methylomicrobium sp.]
MNYWRDFVREKIQDRHLADHPAQLGGLYIESETTPKTTGILKQAQ